KQWIAPTRPGGPGGRVEGARAEGFAMFGRCGIFLVLALWVVGSGCAGTARRPDGSSIWGPSAAWSDPPAPPQTQVAIPATGRQVVAVEPDAKPEGLAKYFPGLHRTPTEAPKLAARYRPSWFGLRPPKVSQVYTTDARVGLNRPMDEPTTLPVALQVPTERGVADRAVTPTKPEQQVAAPGASIVPP